MSKRKGRPDRERYVWLRYWMMDSLAWKSLPAGVVALYIQIARRYNGSNNGRIPYSVREAVALHISDSTASRWLKILQDRGFIVCTKKGAFSLKTVKEASEWMLTEYSSDHPPAHATKDFMRWRPPEGIDPDTLNQQPSHHRKSKTRLPQRNRTVTPVKPYGYPSETVQAKKRQNGYPSETVEAKNSPSTVTPAGHLQLPGTKSGERGAPSKSAVASEPLPNLSSNPKGKKPTKPKVGGGLGDGGRGKGLNIVDNGQSGRPPPGEGWQIAGDRPPAGAVVFIREVKLWRTPQIVEVVAEMNGGAA